MEKQPLGVLVVHGFTASLDCVNGVEQAIRSLGVPTRMPVLRGHGAESPAALRGVTWPEWVADARQAMEDLQSEVDKVIVFGHSMGGLVTLTLAAEYPQEIDSIVVAAAAVQLANPLAPGRPLGFLAPIVVRLLRKVDMPPVYADPKLAAYDTNYEWAPTNAVSSLFEFSRVTRARLPEITVPTLVLQSRNDGTVAPESAEIIFDGISTPTDDKRVIWFEHTEHEMFRDNEREATIQAVVDYVQERVNRVSQA